MPTPLHREDGEDREVVGAPLRGTGSREPDQQAVPALTGFDPARVRCDHCGRFLGFADLAFSKFHFTPLNEFGHEESSWTGPCCRWRDDPAALEPGNG